MGTESKGYNNSPVLPMFLCILGLLAIVFLLFLKIDDLQQGVDKAPRNGMPDKLYFSSEDSELVTRCSKSAFNTATVILQAVDDKGNLQQYFCEG
jgi:hypothetical protein